LRVVEDDPRRAVLAADTTREVEDIQVARWRAMSMSETAQLISRSTI